MKPNHYVLWNEVVDRSYNQVLAQVENKIWWSLIIQIIDPTTDQVVDQISNQIINFIMEKHEYQLG